ncbi:MAG: hypothetical protein IJR61_04895, partial [Clostridia bacterium]|nr:hypothetical protein [Clostridia bacterium]
NNIRLVTEHARKKIAERGGNPDREKALKYVKAFDYGKHAEKLRAFIGKGADAMIANEKTEIEFGYLTRFGFNSYSSYVVPSIAAGGRYLIPMVLKKQPSLILLIPAALAFNVFSYIRYVNIEHILRVSTFMIKNFFVDL